MVAIDRLVPGHIARHWMRPMVTDCLTERSCSSGPSSVAFVCLFFTPALHNEHDDGTYNEGAGDGVDVVPECGFDDVIEEEADHCCRHKCRDQIDREFAAAAALAEAAHDDVEYGLPVKEHDCGDRAGLDDDDVGVGGLVIV